MNAKMSTNHTESHRMLREMLLRLQNETCTRIKTSGATRSRSQIRTQPTNWIWRIQPQRLKLMRRLSLVKKRSSDIWTKRSRAWMLASTANALDAARQFLSSA